MIICNGKTDRLLVFGVCEHATESEELTYHHFANCNEINELVSVLGLRIESLNYT